MSLNFKDSHSRSLRRALLEEALLLQWLGISGISLWPLGAGLTALAGYLFWMSRSTRMPEALVKGVIWGDWAWVAGTAALLAFKADRFSGLGIILLLDVALVVAVFAVLQARGLRAIPREPASGGLAGGHQAG